MSALFLLQENMFQWVRNSKSRFIKVSVLQESNYELNISFNQMEHVEVEQHGQYPVERNPNAYRSMRDYRNPPWMSAPFCSVPPTNAPYGSTYTTLVGGTTKIPHGNQDLHKCFSISSFNFYATTTTTVNFFS